MCNSAYVYMHTYFVYVKSMSNMCFKVHVSEENVGPCVGPSVCVCVCMGMYICIYADEIHVLK